jgi:hypothetical protein
MSKIRLTPLGVRCVSSDCEKGLHCFRPKRRKGAPTTPGGACSSCGATPVDFERVRRCDLADIDYTVEALQLERVRFTYWNADIDEHAINHARRKGLAGIRAAARARLEKSIGAAIPAFDGRQTPREGNAIFYAQHAVAACCRKCVQEWHGLPLGQPLTGRQLDYLTGLVMHYIEKRLSKAISGPAVS